MDSNFKNNTEALLSVIHNIILRQTCDEKWARLFAELTTLTALLRRAGEVMQEVCNCFPCEIGPTVYEFKRLRGKAQALLPEIQWVVGEKEG